MVSVIRQCDIQKSQSDQVYAIGLHGVDADNVATVGQKLAFLVLRKIFDVLVVRCSVLALAPTQCSSMRIPESRDLVFPSRNQFNRLSVDVFPFSYHH